MSRNAVPSFAAMASRARHRARARRLHPGRPGDDRRGQRGARPRARRRLPRSATPSDADVERVRAAARATTRPRRQRSSTSPRREAYAEERKRNPEAYELLGLQPAARHVPRHARRARQRARAARRARARDARRRAHDDRPGDRRGQELASDDTPEDPRRHARGEAHDRRCWRCCWSSPRCCSISNTIRLSLFSRRREVEVMKLVGATDWFIRWPFVIEGIVLGALGGVRRDPAAASSARSRCSIRSSTSSR